MLKIEKKPKNSLNAVELIHKGMLKRRNLANSAILNICDKRTIMRVVK